MEEVLLEEDIKTGFVTASSFPEGIMEAHRSLHKMLPFPDERRYFGMSRPENGTIVYHAAAELVGAEETEKWNNHFLVIKKGTYISETIVNYMEDVQRIERTFKELLRNPNIDPQGYCVEWYLNERDVKCMVRLQKDQAFK